MSEPKTNKEVLILGCGIFGVGTAIEFLKKGGYNVRIVDRVRPSRFLTPSLLLRTQKLTQCFLAIIDAFARGHQSKTLPAADAASTDLNKIIRAGLC
jgi:2-polyprenyl-6-methoxyphenol hydroxylase-like FAD-dependent oxidoreductase